MIYLGFKCRNLLIFIMLILITISSTYCTLQERQKSPEPVIDPGPSAPPPPPGPCKDCTDKCCADVGICINGSNPNLCQDGLKQCNIDCNMNGCKNMTYHFDCGDPGPSAPPPPPGPCKDCIDKCCVAYNACKNGTNATLCENELKQCNINCNMGSCLDLIFHFNCNTEISGPQKGPSPQDPGPKEDPGSQQDSDSEQGLGPP